jgi:hypothetical protein
VWVFGTVARNVSVRSYPKLSTTNETVEFKKKTKSEPKKNQKDKKKKKKR